MENKIKTAVIGIGNMGTAHANAILRGEIPGMELTAVADVRACRRAYAKENFPGVPVFETLDELLNVTVPDAVIIAVPHRLHAELAALALERGCHVMLEKPEDVSVRQAAKLNALAAGKNLVFSMMFNQRTNPLFQKAHELVRSGALGEIRRSVWIVTNWYRTESYYRSGDWRATWAGEGGGVLLNQAPHNLDLWQWIAGMPSEIRSDLAVGKYHDIEVEDDAAIYAKYENGATGVFLTTTGEYPGTNRFEVDGTKGKIVLEEGKLKHWTVEGDEPDYRKNAPESAPKLPVHYEEITSEKGIDGHVLLLRNFTEAISGNETLIAPGPEGIFELSVSNAAYLSAWKGGIPVKLPLSEEDIAEFEQLFAAKKSTSKYAGSDTEGAANKEYLSRWSVQW